MAISDQVRNQLFQQGTSPRCRTAKFQAIRIPTTRGGATRGGLVPPSPGSGRGLWTPEEHLRFLEALDKFPTGPWKCIAEFVGNKTPRQAMTHGQKYRQKIARRRRGLKKIVRDLQFAAVDVQERESDEDAAAPLSVEPNPMELSDQDFGAFVASLDLAEELQADFLSLTDCSDSPLVVATAAINESEITSFSLDQLGAETVDFPPISMSSGCDLPLTTPQQDVHHWVVMDRADASSEVFSAALAEAFHGGNVEGYAFASPLSLPEQLMNDYCQQEMELQRLVFEPVLDVLDEFESFDLR